MAKNAKIGRVMITGGAGYIGAILTPKLLAAGFGVNVLDLYLYGDDVLAASRGNSELKEFKGDIRDTAIVERALAGCDAVIHLACISNDPSFELNPNLGKSINYDSFRPLVRAAKRAGVRRFIYASSSSVYGIKDDPEVTEELPLLPLTDYSKFKALCEQVLAEEREPGFTTLTLRPATVCGYSPRQRLDLTVNILTNHAVNNGKITVFGGGQLRPNLHIEDMTDLYVECLRYPDDLIDGRIFNAGYENHSVMAIAEMVRGVVGPQVGIQTTPTDDNRSYHVSSAKIKRELGFAPRHTIVDAVDGIVSAFKAGKLPNPMNEIRYYNIKLMQAVGLQ
jgi:nucleoside-diphosphate-sugar epimerase